MAFNGQKRYEKFQGNGETTDGSTITAGSYTVSVNCVGEVEVKTTARDNASGEILHGRKVVKFKRVGGTLSVVGSILDLVATTIDGVNMVGAAWTVDASGDDLRIRVTGVAGRTINWQSNSLIDIN